MKFKPLLWSVPVHIDSNRYRYVSGLDCEVVTEYTHHPGHSCRALQFSSRGSSEALLAINITLTLPPFILYLTVWHG